MKKHSHEKTYWKMKRRMDCSASRSVLDLFCHREAFFLCSRNGYKIEEAMPDYVLIQVLSLHAKYLTFFNLFNPENMSFYLRYF
jgi:type IV secretory pathway component VirB8